MLTDDDEIVHVRVDDDATFHPVITPLGGSTGSDLLLDR